MVIKGVISLNMKAKLCSCGIEPPYKDLINLYRKLSEAVKSY